MPNAPLTIAVTGAGGFVGHAVVAELLARGHRVRALIHRRRLEGDGAIENVEGDLFDAASLDRLVAGCDGVVHLVGIIDEQPARGITFQRMHVEGTRNVVDAATRAGVPRYVHMSALGTRSDAVSMYHRTKFAAEQYVQSCGLDWTILRPSMIHGPRGDFMKMEARWARRAAPPFLFMPYFGRGVFGLGGAGMLQPVYVDDVARAFVDALVNPQTIRKAYAVAGAQRVTWPQLHRISARAIVGHSRWVMALPVWKATLLTHLLPRFLLPFNRDQVIMSQEDNTADVSEFVRDFGWTPGGFEEQIKLYADQL